MCGGMRDRFSTGGPLLSPRTGWRRCMVEDMVSRTKQDLSGSTANKVDDGSSCPRRKPPSGRHPGTNRVSAFHTKQNVAPNVLIADEKQTRLCYVLFPCQRRITLKSRGPTLLTVPRTTAGHCVSWVEGATAGGRVALRMRTPMHRFWHCRLRRYLHARNRRLIQVAQCGRIQLQEGWQSGRSRRS